MNKFIAISLTIGMTAFFLQVNAKPAIVNNSNVKQDVKKDQLEEDNEASADTDADGFENDMDDDENFLKNPEIEDAPIANDSDVVTEVSFGCSQDDNPTYIYVSPSCFHCGAHLIKKTPKYLQYYGSTNKLIVKFLPTSAKDLFIMKLLHQRAIILAKNDPSRIPYEFYYLFISYIKHMEKIINKIKPTDEQLEMFKGSNTDPEMIKFQVGATIPGDKNQSKNNNEATISAFEPFSKEEIIAAIPNLDAKYETNIMNCYRESVEYISAVVKTKELTLPLIICEDQAYKTLEEAAESKEETIGSEATTNSSTFQVTNKTHEKEEPITKSKAS